jgi:hypothetical protein
MGTEEGTEIIQLDFEFALGLDRRIEVWFTKASEDASQDMFGGIVRVRYHSGPLAMYE